jgi:glutathione-specific gamma-glutamylcyclotransferase
MTASGELWVFGYGSLMWNPGFAYAEAHRARLDGWHRAFCITSTHHRGNAARPGLVLGLDRGQSCEGIVFRIAPEHAADVVRYLRQREQVNGVYRETRVPVRLSAPPHREVAALAYIVERAHPGYAGALPIATQARFIRGARGISGFNLDYLINTVAHLVELGIRERTLERVLALSAPHAALFMGENFKSPVSRSLRAAFARHPIAFRRMRPLERRRFLYRNRLGKDAPSGA